VGKKEGGLGERIFARRQAGRSAGWDSIQIHLLKSTDFIQGSGGSISLPSPPKNANLVV